MKAKTAKKGNCRKHTFHHLHNRQFTGVVLKESEDFYTILLTSDVAGLNGIWYAGQEVVWSKQLTRIIT